MTFQLDIQVKRAGNIIEIVGTGASVNFYPKNYSKTLDDIVSKYLELQPDLASDNEELAYLKRGLEAQLTDIYKDHSIEQSKKKDTEISLNKEGYEDNKTNGNKKAKAEYLTYKYSANGKSFLHEAVIVGGFPSFIKFENGQVKLTESVPEISRSLIPPSREEYAYGPYEFNNLEEIQTYLDRARSETINSLYLEVKNIIKKYNDQDESVIILLAADTIFSYFQDLFPTTHYLDVVGENDTGKSSIGYTFEYTGYRPVRGTAISARQLLSSAWTG